MARLPQGADLMRDPKAAATPAVRARAVNYGPQLQAAQSLQRAGSSISQGLQIAAHEAEKAQDFETKKALADFRLATEKEFEQQRSAMAPGGGGFSETWEKHYKKRAEKFVKGLPENQKDNVQQALINQHERLTGRAQTAVRNERRRHLEEGLGNTLTGLTERVDIDPASLQESRVEGRKLIESSGLSAARKRVLLKQFRGQMDKTALQARLATANDIGSLNALDKELAGDADKKAYVGPYKNLTVGQRRAVRNQIDRAKKSIISKLSSAVDKLESGAMAGILPQDVVTDLQSRIEASGDPALKAKLAVTVATANEMKKRYQRSPQDNVREATAYRTQVMSSKSGASPKQLQRLKKLEQFAQTQLNMVRDDQLTWAFRSGVAQVAQLPEDLNDASRMGERLEHVTEAAQKFGGGFQYFTKAERGALSDAINKGQVSVVGIAQSMVTNWGMQHANRAIRELAKDSPEAVIAGWLVTNNVNHQAAADIDKVLRARTDPNYVKPKMALKAQEREDEARKVLGDVFDKFPVTQRMAVIRAADMLYEARDKEPGVADASLYQSALRELMGERPDQNGNKFGGLLTQNSGFWSGNKNTIIVPPSWRQDTLKDVLSSVTKEDLEAAGLPLPVDKNGKKIPITRAMTATLVQAGSDLGMFYLSLGDPNTPGQENYVLTEKNEKMNFVGNEEPTPYVLDLNKLEEVLRKRMPSRFWSG